MASRNLTKKFIEARNGAKASRNLGMRDESDGESGLLKVENCLFIVGSSNRQRVNVWKILLFRKTTKQSGATTATRFRPNGY
jgi:hypothetical protein